MALLFALFDVIESQNSCVTKANCSACIQTPKCSWCTQPQFGDGPRCFKPELKSPSQCPEEFIIDPQNEQILIRNEALSRRAKTSSSGSSASSGGSGYESESLIQISPQEVKLKLRISEDERVCNLRSEFELKSRFR